MESLMKYVPFINFLLKIDEKKYYKFIKIRKWILSKKQYSETVVKKTEGAVLMQYKNLLLENKVKIPENITDTFTPSIDLCSDDEDEGSQNKKPDGVDNSALKQDYMTPSLDDDLEIVSVEHIDKAKEKTEKLPATETSICKEEFNMDEASKDIFDKIDQLAADDLKFKNLFHEPVDYTYKMEYENSDSAENSNEGIFQRRATSTDTLFKRRADFTMDEVVVESLNNESKSLFRSKKQIEIIALDSDSESENDGEYPSTSNAKDKKINLSKTDNSDIINIDSSNNNSEILNTDSNSGGSFSAKNSEKLKLLCTSIESVLPEMSDILSEVEEVNPVTINKKTENPVASAESDKENTMEQNIGIVGTPNLDPEQISKVLEDISSKSDFEIDTLYEALQYVRQLNSEQRDLSETPPPAPPPILENSATSLPAPSCYEQQRPQMDQPIAASNVSNVNFAPTVPPIPKPKLNINDPRIKKQLQSIKNSPIFSYNLLNNDLEESIRKICHETVMQPSLLNDNKNCAGPSAAKMSVSGTNKSTITYGEYKRRQLEKKLEMERKREEEQQAKIKAQLEREKLEKEKTQAEQDVRSKLLSTLDPCKEKLYSLWKQQNQFKETEQTAPENQEKENIQTKQVNSAKESHTTDGPSSKTSNKKSKSKASSEQKLNRIYSELRCTVKGFDQIQDYIADEANMAANEMQSNKNSSTTDEEPYTARLIGLRRRSSMHALSAITEQLGSHSEGSDSELSQSRNRRRSKDWSHGSSSESLSRDSPYLMPKRRKTIDEPVTTARRTKALRLVEDETSSSDDDVRSRENVLKEKFCTKLPVIRLHRMSSDFIRKHTKRTKKDAAAKPTAVANQSVRLKKTSEVVENLEESNHKTPKLKKYNNDCQMTERNTVFCVLCRSKPMDLTNHYKGRHKTESYVSRLDWSDLDDLAINTRFATRQPTSKYFRFERYEVECPFCKETIVDQFINLYNHYSVHTGEYAFQCTHCFLSRPYKPDIQSHICHSKACRKATVQVMYRYPPQAQCIYLHYCNICNFVQLNEANVLKHLREHHGNSKAVASNVLKCILAAISDAPDVSHTKKATDVINTADCDANMEPSLKQTDTTDKPARSEVNFKVDDDDIPVSNEPCLEEEFTENEGNACENMLRDMHEERAQLMQPMTIIHNLATTSFNQNTTEMTTSQLNTIQIHQPISIKSEEPESDAVPPPKSAPTPFTGSEQKQSVVGNVNMVYEKYRSYPPNANYLGLFKCMTDDCYYSTDCASDIIIHLTEHSTDAPNQYLQCPYCIFTSDIPVTPNQLVDHIHEQHRHLKFQCSLCCYRSCDASNVHIHQQMHHYDALNTCKIYKTCNDDSNPNKTKNLNEQIKKNVFKISCKICNNASFYHTRLLINHIYKSHNITNANNLNIYSCINCPLTADNKNQLKIHIAIKHPGERPLVYDHNAQVDNIIEDSQSCSNVVDISEPVPYVETTATTNDAISEKSLSQDIKPNVAELSFINEETVKVRLRKLTSHTGIAPDNLYRCPEQSCGGFFSNAELWLRHMKVRHLALECQCPHCPTAVMLPLLQLANHFEQHRRHTYICFYCSTTCATETLARKHAAVNHSEFRQMRLEKISLNISYSYWILIQRELFAERDQFMAEFLPILDERLNELERNEIKNLKQQWPVRDNVPWLDEHLQDLSKRKVARRCLIKDCNYRTLKEESLYYHLSTSHIIAGTQYNCSKCDYHLERCNNLDEVFDHIKLHNEYHFICTACSLATTSRAKITAHIEEQHTARDVPVVHIFRTSDQIYHKIYIVFADNNITFSTMKNCFCCSEKSMSGDVFNLHLKRYHNFSLTYYCEKCTNFSFKSLQEVKPHFEQFHNSGKFKIHCELAARSDLHVLSLTDFQVEVLNPSVPASSSMTVKNEPMDVSDSDNVILIEDDDVLIKNCLKEAEQQQAELPKLKCASISKLLQPNINAATSAQNPQAETPRLKCADFSKMISPNNTLFIPAPTVLQTRAITPVMPVAPVPPIQGYYNYGQQNSSNLNMLTNSLYQMPATTSAQNNNNFIILNKTIIRPIAPNNNSTLTQTGALPLNVDNRNSISNNIQNLPNSAYMYQTSNNGYPGSTPQSYPYNFFQP